MVSIARRLTITLHYGFLLRAGRNDECLCAGMTVSEHAGMTVSISADVTVSAHEGIAIGFKQELPRVTTSLE